MLCTWRVMHRMPLEARFRFCRKCNECICIFSALVSLLAITRWLHIGNVNGFRYLGYAVTCPLMQAELVVLIAPVVPCYKLTTTISALVTFVSLVAGYYASVVDGEIYEGTIEWEQMDFSEAKVGPKFWALVPSVVGLLFLTFVQMPYLALLHTIRGGKKAGLPWGFKRLLLIVAVTWAGFPIWWFLSFEGF